MIVVYRPTGRERMEWYQKTASQAFSFNDAVYVTSSGFVSPAAAASNVPILGLCYRAVKSTDTDYAQNTRIPVFIPDKDTVFLADVGAGTVTQEDVDEFVDSFSASAIDETASTYQSWHIVDIVSATQALVKLAVKGGAAQGRT